MSCFPHSLILKKLRPTETQIPSRHDSCWCIPIGGHRLKNHCRRKEVFGCGQVIVLPKYRLLEMCKHPLSWRYASDLFSTLKHIYNFMLFSDKAVYMHLAAVRCCTRILTHRISSSFGFVFLFFNFYKKVAKEMKFSLCPRYAHFHAETFSLQLCKDPFNCVYFKITGKERYRTCPSSLLSLISDSFPEYE